MTLEVNLSAYQTPDGQVGIVAVAENPKEETIRIGSMSSQLYELATHSETVPRFGQSMGYMQAPHHIKLPPQKSVAFTRTFEREEDLRDDLDDELADRLADEINFLVPTIEETVTATIKVFEQNTDETAMDTITFVPSNLPTRETEQVIASLQNYPQTDNSIQMG